MRAKLDNYEIVSQDGNYFKVNLDGQNIIHEKGDCATKVNMITLAAKAIEKYNERHDLAWGKLR